jgi:hypothetical protein
MRIKRVLAKGVLIALGIALIPNSAVATENVTPGSACKVLNQKIVSQNKTFTCMKSGKKLMWNKGVVVVKPVQTSTTASTPTSTTSSTLTAAPAPTATPTPTAALLEAEPGPTCSRNKNSLKNC